MALREAFGLERTNPPNPPSTSDKPLDYEFGDFVARYKLHCIYY